jgi:hypothetical protein
VECEKSGECRKPFGDELTNPHGSATGASPCSTPARQPGS